MVVAQDTRENRQGATRMNLRVICAGNRDKL